MAPLLASTRPSEPRPQGFADLAVVLIACLGAALGLGRAAGTGGRALPAWLAPAAGASVEEGRRPELLAPARGPLSVLAGPSGATLVADPWAYFARRPFSSGRLPWPEHPEGGFERSFGPLGLRAAHDLPADRPEPLVVLTGDSHLDGVCADDETASAVLERRLSDAGRAAVVLNAACGMYGFPNYLGIVARFVRCRPDAIVVVVYGGNDFGALLPFERERDGLSPIERPAAYGRRLAAAAALEFPAVDRNGAHSLWQALNQVASFAESPELVEPTLERALAYVEAMDELCRTEGVRLIVAYLPPMHDVEPERIEFVHRPVLAALELEPFQVGLTDRLADRFLDGLRARGIESVDARSAFRASDEALYWIRDEHLAVAGQALLAECLEAALAR